MKKQEIIYFVFVIALVVLSRLIPHPSNFTAVGAVVVLGSMLLNSKFKVGISSLVALLISDLILGVHQTMPFTYGAVVLSVLILGAFKPKASWAHLGIYGLVSSLIFFLVTNFGFWMLPNAYYTQDFSGLIQAYVAGIPFFKMELLGTLFYSSVGLAVHKYAPNFITESASNN